MHLSRFNVLLMGLLLMICGHTSWSSACECDPKHPDHCCPKDPSAQWALLIGISEYGGTDSKSPRVHGGEDALTISQVLETSGWKSSNIRRLSGQFATASNIRFDGLRWLLSKVKHGDTVLIYLSGLGTRVADDNGDEADGLDEAFIAADGLSLDKEASLLRDDELVDWLHKLEAKVGAGAQTTSGAVLLLMDVGFESVAQTDSASDVRAIKFKSTQRLPVGALADGRAESRTGLLSAAEASKLQSVVISAGEPNRAVREVTDDQGRAHGPLAWAVDQITRNLKTSSGTLTFGELHQQIVERLASEKLMSIPQIDGTVANQSQHSIKLRGRSVR